MADTTRIEWADSTANLWIGCTKISPGCDHCYAEADWDRRKHRVAWGPHGPRSFCQAGWDVILRMQRRAAANGGIDPDLGRKRRIFVNSLSDFFDNHCSIIWRAPAFQLFEASLDVIIMLVTKRPENIIRMVPESWLMPGGWPAHVWLIVTTEDQDRYDHRWPILRDIPGPAIKALSCEPLLGPIVLRDAWTHLDWCIVGGESGPGARPMHPDWALSLRDQCNAADVPFLFKQWGEYAPALIGPGSYVPHDSPHFLRFLDQARTGAIIAHSLQMLRCGKSRAGRLLDGRTWDEVPS